MCTACNQAGQKYANAYAACWGKSRKEKKEQWYCGPCCFKDKWCTEAWCNKLLKKIKTGKWRQQVKDCKPCRQATQSQWALLEALEVPWPARKRLVVSSCVPKAPPPAPSESARLERTMRIQKAFSIEREAQRLKNTDVTTETDGHDFGLFSNYSADDLRQQFLDQPCSIDELQQELLSELHPPGQPPARPWAALSDASKDDSLFFVWKMSAILRS